MSQDVTASWVDAPLYVAPSGDAVTASWIPAPAGLTFISSGITVSHGVGVTHEVSINPPGASLVILLTHEYPLSVPIKPWSEYESDGISVNFNLDDLAGLSADEASGDSRSFLLAFFESVLRYHESMSPLKRLRSFDIVKFTSRDYHDNNIGVCDRNRYWVTFFIGDDSGDVVDEPE